MSLALIELNDAEINVSIEGDLISCHPGTAILQPQKLLIGRQAHAQARLQPRLRNNRFWDQLSTEPIPEATDLVRHNADLAFKQLEALWDEVRAHAEGIIIAVPSTFSKQDLGLILGMCQAGKIPVRSMVDLAVLTASSTAVNRPAFYLDISLHQTVLTEIKSGVAVTRGQSHVLSDTGLFRITERCANSLADQFIQTNRFDPLHEAHTEQALFDQLDDWLTDPGRANEHRIDVNLEQTSYACTATLEQLTAACSDLYPTLIQGIRTASPGKSQILVSHRLLKVPGLETSLALLPDTEIVYLDAAATRSRFATIEKDLFSELNKVTLITTLPAQSLAAQQENNSGSLPENRPIEEATHMLSGHIAYSLTDALLEIQALLGNSIKLDITAQGVLGLTPIADTTTRVNSQPLITARALHCGDVIESNGQSFTVISVL